MASQFMAEKQVEVNEICNKATATVTAERMSTEIHDNEGASGGFSVLSGF